MCAILFDASCPNYAQWMASYHLDLLYIDEAHAAACVMFKTGAVRPTNKQTILKESCGLEFRADNVSADVSSRLKGIASFSKSVSVKKRWRLTSPVLNELISHLIESQD